MMGSLNSFGGVHAATAVVGSGHNTLMGGATGIPGLSGSTSMGSIGLHQIGTAGIPAAEFGFGSMMGGSAGIPGLNSGTIMGGIGLHQTGNAGVSATGLGIGSIMGGIIQDTANGSHSAVTPGIAQSMLDIMDDMPGIHLVGLSHMGLDFSAIS